MSERTVNGITLQEMMEQEFAQGRGLELTVTGHSMGPTLRNLRDQVFLVSPQKRRPCRGEIVFFRRGNGSFVLHRILKEKEDGRFIVNGDAQVWTEVIKPEQILAVVEGIRRKGEYISSDEKRYQRYVKVWQALRPARPCMIVVLRAVKKIAGGRKW